MNVAKIRAVLRKYAVSFPHEMLDEIFSPDDVVRVLEGGSNGY
jgi:hypothetical protein